MLLNYNARSTPHPIAPFYQHDHEGGTAILTDVAVHSPSRLVRAVSVTRRRVPNSHRSEDENGRVDCKNAGPGRERPLHSKGKQHCFVRTCASGLRRCKLTEKTTWNTRRTSIPSTTRRWNLCTSEKARSVPPAVRSGSQRDAFTSQIRGRYQ